MAESDKIIAEAMERFWSAEGGNEAGVRAAIEYALATVTTDLVEALKPFAAVAEHDIGADEADGDLFRPIGNNHAPLLTVGDMRRALATLSRALGQEG